MNSELRLRLDRWYDEEPAARVMQGSANWPPGFGSHMRPEEICCLVVHQTGGWPSRTRQEEFVQRYIDPAADDRGIGTQFFIADDGTVARLIELPRVTWHVPSRSARSLGVENANRFDSGPPPSARWHPASGEDDDLPGLKLWMLSGNVGIFREVVASWWTTDRYGGPGRGPSGGGTPAGAGQMRFSEEQYRSLAFLTRYVLERFGLPRSLPVLPHAIRANLYDGAESWHAFRRIVLADERAHMIMRHLADPDVLDPPIAISSAGPEDIDAVLEEQYEESPRGLQDAYLAGTDAGRRRNDPLDELLSLYRGVHGHGLPRQNRADCPGPLFDFHRLAREVWDWWWYPFDVAEPQDGGDGRRATVELSGRAFRGYRHFDEDTLLLEHYWDERGDEPARAEREVPGLRDGEWSPAASPATFELDPETPVYALANGELVAAQLPTESAELSLGFTLVRHRVHHHRHELPGATTPETLSFEVPPSVVYSLYVHLGLSHAVSFDEPADHNPDWLNRVLVRKRECDLGVEFHDHRQPTQGFPQARWDDRPPSGPDSPERPTTLEGWRTDRELLGGFLEQLRSGRTALAPRHQHAQTITVLLGDYLGDSGPLGRPDGHPRHGIRVETFSPTFVPPGFEQRDTDGWEPTGEEPVGLRYPSEWSDTDWWQAIAFQDLLAGLVAPQRERLPRSGRVLHFHPFRFMAWINEVTWRHEWAKHHVVGPDGEPVERPERPRSRRASPLD